MTVPGIVERPAPAGDPLAAISPETRERLDAYLDLLRAWQERMNLVSRSTLPDAWTRHVVDSAQLLPLAPTDWRTWLDLGSGAGFPGLVAAILERDRPGVLVVLVESSGKKCAFLREAIRVTEAPAQVRHERIEVYVATAASEPAEIVSARALAPLADLLHVVQPFMRQGVVGLFPKGANAGRELTEAARTWDIRGELIPSVTDWAARILRLHQATPRSPAQGLRSR